MRIFKILFPCSFNEHKCKDSKLGCKCGKKTTVKAPPPAPSPAQQAQEISAARDRTDPREAQRQFEILTNPQFGLGPTTQFLSQQRASLFPLEEAIKARLGQNILDSLSSPTGISPQQQQAIDARRGQAQDELTRALRTRSNLGGGLFGGRSQLTEQRAVQDLQNQFAEEDIAREERARLNAIQASLPLLQILFPEVGLSPPAFQSAVQNPNTLAQSLISQRGQDAQIADQNAQRQAALQSALFQSLGNAAAASLRGPSTVFNIAGGKV